MEPPKSKSPAKKTAKTKTTKPATKSNRAQKSIKKEINEASIDVSQQAVQANTDVFKSKINDTLNLELESINRAIQTSTSSLDFAKEAISGRRPLVYLSYIINDIAWREQLLQVLAPYEEKSGFTVWLKEFQVELEMEDSVSTVKSILKNAVASIVLVSKDWLDSDYIQLEEWPELVKRSKSGMPIFPIIVSPCNWERYDLIEFQVYPKSGVPLSESKDPGELARFAGIFSEELSKIIEDSDEKQTSSPLPSFQTARQLSRYRSDVAATEDRLGIQSDVTNLCQVIMAKKWKPPLSIGLFGDWGSGKSSFINLMKHTIDDIAHMAGQTNESAFVKHVIQIDFNAWHYLDANLWANLTVRILDEINRTLFESDKDDQSDEQRKQIIATLKVLQKDIEQSEERLGILNNDIKTITTEITDKRSDQQKTLISLSELKAMILDSDNAIADEEFQELLDKAAGELHLKGRVNLSELENTVRKLTRTSTRLFEAWSLVKGRKRWLMALPPLALLAWLFASQQFQGIEIVKNTIIEHMTGALATCAAALVSWKKTLAPHWKAINSGMDTVNHLVDKVASKKSNWIEKKQKAIEELKSLEMDKRHEIKSLETIKSEREREYHTLNIKLDQLMKGQGLEEFLLSRTGSPDYREQLGIISLVHKDMKELQRKLDAGITVGSGDDETTKRFDRVVLYIDDLDRCTPGRVVEVLQAIHLLLSIPMFVVVVAVDPRWLQKCLLTHYSELFHNAIDTEEEWAMTPQNYLEKIFQIPYTLPPMKSLDFPEYVEDLFNYTEKEPDTLVKNLQKLEKEVDRLRVQNRIDGPKQNDTPKDDKPKTDPLKEARKRLQGATRLFESQKRAERMEKVSIDPNPESLEIEKDEKQFVTRLLPLLVTPRTTKRLLNVYRLIRVAASSEDLKALKSGEYEAVLVLLAILYSYPRIAGDFFTGIRSAKVSLLKEYIMEKSGSDGDWANLEQAMNTIDCIQTIDIYKRWIDVVGRFSFRVGHELKRNRNVAIQDEAPVA